MPYSITVGIPAYNEEATIEAVVRAALSEEIVSEVIIADDQSQDSTRSIVERLSYENPKVKLNPASRRSGQLHGWLRIAREAANDTVVFIDADAKPSPGSIGELGAAIAAPVVLASGRVIPIRNRPFAAAYFSAEILHAIRARPRAVEAVIGRFFAVDRKWFLDAVERDDVLANDAYLVLLAQRAQRAVCYVPKAVVGYHAPTSLRDFVAQRQRADRGLEQLRDLGFAIATSGDMLIWRIGTVLRASARMPFSAIAWAGFQAAAIIFRANRLPGKSMKPTGIWETQASTKRKF